MTQSQTTWQAIASLLLVAAMVSETSCSWFLSSPKSQEEVGAVNLSVTLVSPWEDYIAALSPNFSLSANDAVGKIIPRTGIVEEKILDTLGLTARVGLPQSSELVTKTTNLKSTQSVGEESKETITIAEDKSEKKEPGKLPDAATRAQGAEKGIKDLPGAPAEAGKSLRNDPMLEYTAATALYQEVQLLNRYVSDAALRHGMEAYIVRLQLGIVPFRRNLGFDLYTKIGFFPKRHGVENMSAYVLPLLVTDNLEGTLASRTQDTIRQLSIALSVMKAGVVGTAGVDRLKEAFESELFTEPNSLFTIGRVTDNTLGARFGAVRQGKDSYSIVPRTHNVTLVLLVPKDFSNSVGKAKACEGHQPQSQYSAKLPICTSSNSVSDLEQSEVRVVASTTMRDAKDGKMLPQPGRNERADHVGDIVQTFLQSYLGSEVEASQAGIEHNDRTKLKTKQCLNPSPDPHPAKVLCVEALLQTVWLNDFKKFECVLEEAGWRDSVGRYTRDLWMDVVESLDRSQYSGVRFELPARPQPMLPDARQAILLVDDGKSQMKTTLIGGRGLVANQVRAVLELQLDGEASGQSISLPGTITTENGADLLLSFPSPAVWKLGKLKFDASRLIVTRHVDARWNVTTEDPVTFSTVKYRKPDEPTKPVFTLKSIATLIQPEVGQLGAVSLFIEFLKDAKKNPLASYVEISVEGAEIAQAEFIEKLKTDKKSLPAELGKMVVSSDGTLDLKLRNLDSSKKVIVKSVAKDKQDKAVGGDHADVTFEVGKTAGKPYVCSAVSCQ